MPKKSWGEPPSIIPQTALDDALDQLDAVGDLLVEMEVLKDVPAAIEQLVIQSLIHLGRVADALNPTTAMEQPACRLSGD